MFKIDGVEQKDLRGWDINYPSDLWLDVATQLDRLRLGKQEASPQSMHFACMWMKEKIAAATIGDEGNRIFVVLDLYKISGRIGDELPPTTDPNAVGAVLTRWTNRLIVFVLKLHDWNSGGMFLVEDIVALRDEALRIQRGFMGRELSREIYALAA